jgi:hypothetical protein
MASLNNLLPFCLDVSAANASARKAVLQEPTDAVCVRKRSIRLLWNEEEENAPRGESGGEAGMRRMRRERMSPRAGPPEEIDDLTGQERGSVRENWK